MASVVSVPYEGRYATFQVCTLSFSHTIPPEKRECSKCHGFSAMRGVLE